MHGISSNQKFSFHGSRRIYPIRIDYFMIFVTRLKQNKNSCFWLKLPKYCYLLRDFFLCKTTNAFNVDGKNFSIIMFFKHSKTIKKIGMDRFSRIVQNSAIIPNANFSLLLCTYVNDHFVHIQIWTFLSSLRHVF